MEFNKRRSNSAQLEMAGILAVSLSLAGLGYIDRIEFIPYWVNLCFFLASAFMAALASRWAGWVRVAWPIAAVAHAALFAYKIAVLKWPHLRGAFVLVELILSFLGAGLAAGGVLAGVVFLIESWFPLRVDPAGRLHRGLMDPAAFGQTISKYGARFAHVSPRYLPVLLVVLLLGLAACFYSAYTSLHNL